MPLTIRRLSGSARASAGAVLVACAAALLNAAAFRLPPATSSDLDQLLFAGRALLAGRDPYAEVATHFPFPLFYPLPAVLLTLPIAPLPLELARSLWAALVSGLFAWAAWRYGRGLWVALLSPQFFQAVVLGQWSPLLTAGVVLPWLGVAWAAKPTIGAELAVGYLTRRHVWAGLAILGLSLVLLPSWPHEWLVASSAAIYVPALLRPGGFLLALAVFRWRLPEARMLAAMAVIPQTTALYETLPLFLCCRSRRDGYLLAILGYVAAFSGPLLDPPPSGSTAAILVHSLDARWPLTLLLCYVPALMLVFTGSPPRNPLPQHGRYDTGPPPRVS
jgi:hypothetical protein